MTAPVIGFAGMTHLGLVSGVSASEKGFNVICFDPDAERIACLARQELPISEPKLDELITKNTERLKFTSTTTDLSGCDVIYVSPDVPTDDSGRSDLGPVNALLDSVFAAARKDAVVVLLSQVPPGFTRGRQRLDCILYYQVETLIFGRAVERALCPERYIVGCADPAQPLPTAYQTFLAAHNCPILPMRYESAELAKISINMCLVASVGVANTLAELCENIGADWSEIAPALKLDKRIGQFAYLAAGLGIAGGNLERDLTTVVTLSEQHGTDSGIVSAWIANSRHRKDWSWNVLNKLVLKQDPAAKIAVLGLAYKEDTHSTKNSPSLSLLSHLHDCSVVVYDPVVSPSDAGIPFKVASSSIEAIHGADVVCIMTPWGEFRALPPSAFVKQMRGRLLIDPYRVVDGRAARAAGLRYVTLGVAPETT